MIGKKHARGGIAPYAAAFFAELFEQLKHYAEERGGRLPVPATCVLDEMPLTCPAPLHDMLAESREPMITIIAAVQTLAQLRAKFGPDDGDTIRSACPVEVHYGGEKRIEDLEAVSEVIGEHDTWQGDMDNLLPMPLLPPGALRMLKKGKAVILMPECRPVLAALPAIWDRRGHQRATAGHPAFRPAVAERTALPAAERDRAIALVLLYLALHQQVRRPMRAIEQRRPIALPPAAADRVHVVNGRHP
jgi:type IV secretion system protein VirD4